MSDKVSEIVTLGFNLVITAAIIFCVSMFTSQARHMQFDTERSKSETAALLAEREWERHKGIQTGADIIDFTSRYIGEYAVFVDEIEVPAGTSLRYVYNTILSGDAERYYNAVLIINENGVITGVKYIKI